MKHSLVIISLLLSTSLFSQQTELLSGKKVGELTFEKILNYDSPNAKLSDFSNKVVILDFWATWCAPCIPGFAHFDSLKLKFSKDLQIFMVTSESEKRIETFLNKFSTNLPIVIDTNYSIKRQFPHRIIPHTVIIDKNGIVRAVTTPEKITPVIIENILNDGEVNLKEKKETINSNFSYDDPLSRPNSLFSFTLTGYQEDAPSRAYKFRDGRLLIINKGLRRLYQEARNFPLTSRVLFDLGDHDYLGFFDLKEGHKYRPSTPEQEKKHTYCLEVIAPGKTADEVRTIMLNYLHNNFQLKSRIEKMKIPVKVLKRTGDLLKLPLSAPGTKRTYGMSGNGISVTNAPASDIAFFLEGFCFWPLIPVVDETGLKDKYDINIPFHVENPDAFFEELLKFGLEVIDAEREVDMLILYEDQTAINEIEG